MTIDQDKNIIFGDGATAKKNPNSTEEGTGMIVIGNSAAATGLDSIALGTNAVAQATTVRPYSAASSAPSAPTVHPGSGRYRPVQAGMRRPRSCPATPAVREDRRRRRG